MMWIAVALGGALGALARYALINIMAPISNSFPWPIWTANIIGSALIGILYVLIIEKGIIAPEWRPFLVVGFLGALTTFSTFALDGVLLWQNGHGTTAMIYVLSSVIGCFICAIAGMVMAQRLF